MPEKKPWTQQEDKVLRQLFEVRKVPKWSTIAHIMAEQYHMLGRNGKQCRQRYQSVLEPSFQHLQWTVEEEKLMYKLHDQVGNKWAQIAQRMPGRSDNCVKNHFYSNLRKAIRKLNKIISQNFKPAIKQIRPIVIYKIIEATDQHFKITSVHRKDISLNCGKLKNKLLQLANDNCQFQNNTEELRELTNEIHAFSRDYKRKPKKDRRGVAQSLNLMKVPKIDKFKCASDVQYDSDSIEVDQENSIEMGEKAEEQQKKQKQAPVVHKIKEVIQVSKNSLHLHFSKREQAQSKGIQLFLKNKGLLYEGGNSNQALRQSLQSNISDFKHREDFNLGESIDVLKTSFIFKQSGDVCEDKLFRSIE